jgi:DNA-binding NarL/FixJ family response regulator
MDHDGTRPIRVCLVDDHEVVRRGLRELLATQPDIEVVGESASAAQAIRRIPALRADVAVVDMRLPDGSGVQVDGRTPLTAPARFAGRAVSG